jgi:hypothetical protein
MIGGDCRMNADTAHAVVVILAAGMVLVSAYGLLSAMFAHWGEPGFTWTQDCEQCEVFKSGNYDMYCAHSSCHRPDARIDGLH